MCLASLEESNFLIDCSNTKIEKTRKIYQFWCTPRRRGCCSNFWDKCEVPWRQQLLYCLRLKYDCEKNHWETLLLFALEPSPWGSFREWHLCGWNIGKIIYLHSNLLFLTLDFSFEIQNVQQTMKRKLSQYLLPFFSRTFNKETRNARWWFYCQSSTKVNMKGFTYLDKKVVPVSVGYHSSD